MHIYRIPTRITEIQQIPLNSNSISNSNSNPKSKSFLSNCLPKLNFQNEGDSPKKLVLPKEKVNYSVGFFNKTMGVKIHLIKFLPLLILTKSF